MSSVPLRDQFMENANVPIALLGAKPPRHVPGMRAPILALASLLVTSVAPLGKIAHAQDNTVPGANRITPDMITPKALEGLRGLEGFMKPIPDTREPVIVGSDGKVKLQCAKRIEAGYEFEANIIAVQIDTTRNSVTKQQIKGFVPETYDLVDTFQNGTLTSGRDETYFNASGAAYEFGVREGASIFSIPN